MVAFATELCLHKKTNIIQKLGKKHYIFVYKFSELGTSDKNSDDFDYRIGNFVLLSDYRTITIGTRKKISKSSSFKITAFIF
jgi:hypothetical protein